MTDRTVAGGSVRWVRAAGAVLLAAVAVAGCESAEPLTHQPTTPTGSATTPTPEPVYSYNSIREVVTDGASPVPDDVPAAISAGFKELVTSQCRSGPVDSGTFLAICDTTGQPLLVGPVVVTGDDIEKAEAATGASGMPTVEIALTTAGSKVFADFTSENVTKRLAILDGDDVCLAPSIQGKIPGGKISISFGQDTDVDDVLECLRK